MAISVTTASPVVSRNRRRQIWQALEGYLCILPWLIGFICFTAGPMIAALAISFTHWSMLEPPQMAGWANFERALTKDPLFWTSLYNTAYLSFLSVPLQLLAALLVALGLNQQLKGVHIFRTIFYLPSQMPVVANALLWLWIFQPDFGLANVLMNSVGLPSLRWLFDINLSKPSILIITLWAGIGTPMIIFLAGLQGVPESLYEAANIDGAGALDRFRHITLPMLSPIIFFNLIIGIINSFQAYFTLVFVATQGGPANSTLIYIIYIYFKAFQDFNMGYAAALAWILFLIVLVLTAVNFSLARLWVHYEGGDRA
jgi:multiple sugar transport system permease protein